MSLQDENLDDTSTKVSRSHPPRAAANDVVDVYKTTCCVVGAGPGGAVLALLLARRDIDVTLLEMHKDFDREFRGDTIHPSVLEILDEIGLADRLHKLRHAKVYGPTIQAADGAFRPFDLRRLKTRFPYIMLMHQPVFLEFITGEAAKFPNFRLVMGANVQRLVEENGVVAGIRYLADDTWHEVHALLTVGADGRFSKVRQLAGFEPVKTSPPMDVLWFRLPKLPEDPPAPGGVVGAIGRGHIFVALDRYEYWQAAYVFPKGRYQELRAQGLAALRRSIVQIEPRFAKHLEQLKDWQETSLLSVESSRCPRWYKPGLLLIGDAAHVMSPVGGVGINYAIQDAVVAHNVLAKPLQAGRVTLAHLAEVQRQREWPTRVIHAVQTSLQKRVVSSVLRSRQPIRIPWYVRLFFRIPVLRDLPPRLIAFGVRRVYVQNSESYRAL